MRIVNEDATLIVEYEKDDIIYTIDTRIYMCNKNNYYGGSYGDNKILLYNAADAEEANEAFQYIIEYEGLSLLKASGNPVLTDSSTIDEMKRDVPMANEYEFCNIPKICNLKKFREKYSKTLINS